MLLAVAATIGSWHAAPPLLTARAAHAVVATSDAVWVLGGSGGETGVERFDGKRWAVATHLPHGGLNAPAAVALGGRIFLIGGFADQTNLPVDTVDVYDPHANTWSSAAPLPAPRGGHAAVVLDGRIHVLGGGAAPLPAPRGGHAAVVLDGRIHVLGGGNSQSTIADHSVFDPQTNTWSSAAPLPHAEGSVAAVVLGGRLYAIGGRSGFSDFGDVYVYDAQRDAWTRGPSIPPRGTAGVVAYKSAIYVFGGESQANGAVLGDVLRLSDGKWHTVSKLPTPRNYAPSSSARRSTSWAAARARARATAQPAALSSSASPRN
jgi:N-acetylneuraminic acid mutarotase